jgi:hypothetical protein
MKTIVQDYLWFTKLSNIDNNTLYDTCCKIDKKLREVLPPIAEDNFYGCFSSYYHPKYNLLTFHSRELHKLHTNIVKNVMPLVDKNTQYYIRCWVNLFEPGMNIDWHMHWLPEAKAYHGFYCVNTQGESQSYTDYRIPGQPNEIRVMSEDGLLVFGKSDDDRHKSSPWENNDKYRITIAFDIVPGESLEKYWPDYNNGYSINNFIPMVKYQDITDK